MDIHPISRKIELSKDHKKIIWLSGKLILFVKQW